MNQHDANQEAKDRIGAQAPCCSDELPTAPEKHRLHHEAYISSSGKWIPLWGELGWTLLEMMQSGLSAENTRTAFSKL